jgi:glycosyltransferase involved in cell wall biosynthesis
MIDIVFIINSDNELYFSSFYNFFIYTDLTNLNPSVTTYYKNCGDAFKTSIEHFNNKTKVTYNTIDIKLLELKEEIKIKKEYTLIIDSNNFIINSNVSKTWLSKSLSHLKKNENSTKLFISKNSTDFPYIIKSSSHPSNIKNEKSLMNTEDVFINFYDDLELCRKSQIGLFEKGFENRFNVNSHIPILVFHGQNPSNDLFNQFQHRFLKFLHVFTSSKTQLLEINKLLAKYSPKTIVTIAESSNTINLLSSLSFEIRKKWINYTKYDEFKISSIEYCIFASFNHNFADANPLISIITPTFESKHRIFRPYNSLKLQTYNNWEWIIIDDSNSDDTWTELKRFAEEDFRIQIHKRHENSGYIGKNKFFCSSIAKGELIFELDHDDDLTNDALTTLINAYKKYPDAGLFYSDFIECDEPSKLGSSYCHPFSYGDYFGLGFGSYYRQWYNNAFQFVAKTPRINPYTLRHIVGVPNHFRCWTKKAYNDIGSHNQDLSVVDDYDLILRTIFKYRWVHIPQMLYIQYRNSGGSNFTFYRNKLIQFVVLKLQQLYESKIHSRLIELNVKDDKNIFSNPYPNDYKIINFEFPLLEHIYYEPDNDPNNPCISIIVPTYNRPNDLKLALDSIFSQSYQNFEILLIGDCCPTLDSFIYKYPFSKDKRLKWYNLDKNNGEGGATPRNYALKMICNTKLCAYLDDDNEWLPDHLQSLLDCKKENPDASYIFSSMLVEQKEIIFDQKPRLGRIDTNCLLHEFNLVVKYGLWKNRIDGGYAHDWEFVSRWKDEKWAATKKCTVIYNTKYNLQTFDSILNL